MSLVATSISTGILYRAAAARTQTWGCSPVRNWGEKSVRRQLANYRLQVFDHDQTLLACNYGPAKTLCAIDRNGTGKQAQTTPSHNRSQKGCANISRTGSHIHRIREEITHIDEELAADPTPLPIRQRLQQRRA
ncbi:hypothetical protein ACFWRV_06770 [Streptomyces sp. NPDC058576]|uniref:hypothetical protein n=1 Tax=Streptomyces sp. NPDC058576 TaxID=3346547 RepID=UPI00365A4A23